MSKDYNLPDITAKLVKAYVEEGKDKDKCKNLSLILDKYPPAYVPGNSQGKSDWLRRLESSSRTDPTLIQAAYNRWYAMMSKTEATLFNATLDWRMIVGLGGETILETDITLHHLYGIPFIPGSALKGLTRTYVTGEVDGHKSKQIDDDDEVVQRIFGSQEQAGTVIFFDAMPSTGQVKFVLDIMNPHYPDYYNGTKPPTNDQNPVPVTFLTVANTTFTFALALRNPNDTEHKGDVETVKKWLQEALQNYGVGGKTSAGYGYFKKEMPFAEPPQPEKAQQPVAQTQSPSRPTEHIRPKIPQFRGGQEITGSVVAPTDALRRIAPSDARAFLRYQSFATTDVLIVVSAEETQNWKPGETRICVFVREEIRDGCTVLVCQPRVKKDRDKKK